MSKFLKYFLLGVIFWSVVDFTTTQAIKNPSHYYSTFLPALLIFYFGFPILFSLLIYKLKLNDTAIFIAALFGIIIVEIIFAHNALLFTFPVMLIAIPAAILIYSLLAFAPKWIVDGEIKNNKWKLIIMTMVYVLVSLATLFSNG